MARPTLLNPERHEIIVNAIRDGCDLDTAAGLAGVSYATLRSWEVRGLEAWKVEESGKKPRIKEQPYLAFVKATTLARAEIKQVVIGSIITDEDWRAKMTWLERRDRANWGPETKAKVDLTITDSSVNDKLREAAAKVAAIRAAEEAEASQVPPEPYLQGETPPNPQPEVQG